MRPDGLPFFGFAAAVLVLDGLLWSYHPAVLAGLLLLAPAAAAVVAGIAVTSRPSESDALRLVPELSLATALCSAALAAIALAAIFGLWLLLIGIGLGALGVGGVVRELLASRKERG
jgi:hypothetical protein